MVTASARHEKIRSLFKHLLRAILMFNYRKQQENIKDGCYVTLTVSASIGDEKSRLNVKSVNKQLQSNDKTTSSEFDCLATATTTDQVIEQFDLQLIECMSPKSLGNMELMDWVVLMMKYLSTFEDGKRKTSMKIFTPARLRIN